MYIKNWSINAIDFPGDPSWTAPEVLTRKYRLTGDIYDSSKFTNGTCITTSNIETIYSQPLSIKTKTGTVYHIDGDPTKGYKTFVEETKGNVPLDLIDFFKWQCPNVEILVSI